MFRQLKYFQSVVRCGSFSEAAEECHISQSAISQQIQALERDLGFPLLERKSRKFHLTAAGEHFYRKSLVLTADLERICSESAKIAHGDKSALRIGYLRSYGGKEFHQALAQFSADYPDITLEIQGGTHEELYRALVSGQIDLALNDQRRTFSQSYVNLILKPCDCAIEITSRSPLAQLEHVTPEDLKNTPCILVTSLQEQQTEEAYYREIVGFQSNFLFAGTLEEARMLVASGMGFLPIDISGELVSFGASITRIPLFQNGEQTHRNFCLFWKKERSNSQMEAFSKLLHQQFL